MNDNICLDVIGYKLKLAREEKVQEALNYHKFGEVVCIDLIQLLEKQQNNKLDKYRKF